MNDLAGKHVLVTGASRGVGAEVAAMMRSRGARLSLFSRTGDEERAHADDSVIVFRGDLTRADDTAKALNIFEQRFGPVDILVNNAGYGRYEPFATSSLKVIEQTIAVNFTGLVRLTHAVLPSMIRRKSGLLIHVASDLGRRRLANMAVYTATKHAVVGFSQALARELRPFGIRSTVVLPGLIDSHFGGRNPGDVDPEQALTPEDVARAIIHIAGSPDSILIDEVSLRSRGQEV
jgi:hypothetical protein